MYDGISLPKKYNNREQTQLTHPCTQIIITSTVTVLMLSNSPISHKVKKQPTDAPIRTNAIFALVLAKGFPARSYIFSPQSDISSTKEILTLFSEFSNVPYLTCKI